jgi:hypothetical protein
MTMRVISHLPSVEALRAALPAFVDGLQETVRTVETRYNELVTLYNRKLTEAQNRYDEAMAEIEHLRNCSCSDDCSCLSRYQALSGRIYSEFMRRVGKLQAIVEPVESRMRQTPMFQSMQTASRDVEPYQEGLGNFIKTALAYLETGR